jgi:hypothetical protein
MGNMTNVLGHIGVSASFDPTARVDGKLLYLAEAEQLRAADPDGVYRGFTFPLDPGAPEDCAQLCAAFRQLGFDELRGIVTGVELCDQTVAAASRKTLVQALQMAVANGISKVFCVAQEWPAGARDADFETDLLPPFVGTVRYALQQVPGITEFGIEPLIPVEQQHVNSLTKARHMAQLVNQALVQQRVYPVPDLAHLYGLADRDSWDRITDELIDAIDAGEVPYAHLSMPESRTDHIVAAIQAGDVPERALLALRKVPYVDTEGFDPNDQFLGDLRRLVPKFQTADASGWTEGKRFGRFVEAAQYFASLS